MQLNKVVYKSKQINMLSYVTNSLNSIWFKFIFGKRICI